MFTVLALLLFQGSVGLAMNPLDANLYGKTDPGILSLESDEVSRTVVGSNKPWMVQFYSSWCGHCKHFQPTFSQFGLRVQGWTDVMGIGVVNCAAEHNNRICRDYDIFGYPSVKVFPPNATANDRGKLQRPAPDVDSLVDIMTSWIQEQQSDPKNRKFFINSPSITMLKNIQDLGSKEAFVVIEKEGNLLRTSRLILDLYAVTKHKSNKLTVRRMDQNDSKQLDPQTAPLEDGTIVAVKSDGSVTIIDEKADSNEALEKIVLKLYNDKFPNDKLDSLDYSRSLTTVKPTTPNQVLKKTESDVKRRRYTVYLQDAERAMLYALSHEIGQRKVIGGKSLTTLKQFLRVLRLYYPQNQEKVMDFLQQLFDWVETHTDAIRGVDFESKIKELQKPGVFSTSTDYVGCKGSKAAYGGYPCGLWTLWHLLTVQHLAVDGNNPNPDDNQEVLMAMVHYVSDFFGCRDCARHFLSMAENGKAVARDVMSADDAVLWLWKSHNRVNQRLMGDISDDPLFPKAVFPDQKHCPECYNEIVAGRNLDVEFHKDKVSEFLTDLYFTNLDYTGLSKHSGERPHHLPKIQEDEVDDTNFLPNPVPQAHDRRVYTDTSATTTWFFTMADISICFVVYLGSMLLIVVICYKFCNKRMIARVKHFVAKSSDHSYYEPLKMV